MKPADVSLTRAITDGDIAAVRSLVAAGSDVNTTIGGQTPLILAVAFRRTDILKLLLEAGANPHLQDGLGMNAIDWAKRKGFSEEELLLANHRVTDELSTNNRDSNSTIPETGTRSEIIGPTLQETRESRDRVSSHEKSQRWLAGLKKRLEEQSLRAKQTQLDSAAQIEVEGRPEEKLRTVGVPDHTADASMTLPYSEVVPVLADGASDAPTSTSAQAAAFTISKDVGDPPPPVELPHKYCPKCYSTYNSDLLAYCAIDMTPLVGGDMPATAASQANESRVLLWLLIGVTFIAAWGLTSLIVSDFRRWEKPAVETSPSPTAGVNELPVVMGGLSGKQVDVPNLDYPVTAPGEHLSGKVIVRVTVNKEGQVTAAKVIEGDKRLREAALSSARKATFSPEKLNGKTAVGTISYTLK